MNKELYNQALSNTPDTLVGQAYYDYKQSPFVPGLWEQGDINGIDVIATKNEDAVNKEYARLVNEQNKQTDYETRVYMQEQIKQRKAKEAEQAMQADEEARQKKERANALQSALANVGGRVGRGGALTSNTGYLSVQRPYLVMSLPHLNVPEDYGHYYGYPCNMTVKLDKLSGYTVVSDCHLDNFTCTETELRELEALLKSGVIL